MNNSSKTAKKWPKLHLKSKFCSRSWVSILRHHPKWFGIDSHCPVFKNTLFRSHFSIFYNCFGTPDAVGFFNLKDTHGLVYRYPMLRGQFTIPNICLGTPGAVGCFQF